MTQTIHFYGTTIIKAERMVNTMFGNPRWKVWLDRHDAPILTAKDAQVGHTLLNSDMTGRVHVTLNAQGQITHIEPVKEGW